MSTGTLPLLCYTEAKLAEISGELLRDLKKYCPFYYNFDDTEKEPSVLPAKFPNILVNGATGISAGYATDIPPHNLSEAMTRPKIIDKPSVVDELMNFVKVQTSQQVVLFKVK